MMNNQEFTPPNAQPLSNDPREQGRYTPPPFNDDPREQPWQGMPPGQMYGEKLQPQQRKRRGLKGCLIAFVTVLVLFSLLAAVGGFVFYRFGSTAFGPGVTENHTYQVSTTSSPTLVINDPVGTVHVHSSKSSTVSIQATKRTEGFGGNPNNIHVIYNDNTQTNTITVTVDNGPRFLGVPLVDFNITVPDAANLNLKSDTGSIDVTGVTGQMSLQSNTGSITAEQDNLTTSSQLTTDTGSVTFNGTLAQNSSYVFSTNTGSVHVTLPADSTFHVDAKTDTGSFHSDFPGLNPDKSGVGNEVHGDVGNSPNTNLTLTTNTGSIDLNQGK